MKFILLCLFSSLISMGFSQDYDLLETGKEKGMFFYRLRILNSRDSSHYTMENTSTEFLEFFLLDNEGEPVSATIVVKNKTSNTSQSVSTGFDGYLQIALPTAEYELSFIHYPSNDPVGIELSGDESKGRKLTVHLGKAPDLYPHIIYSKRKLETDDLDQIVDCIMEAKDFSECSNSLNCLILMEI